MPNTLFIDTNKLSRQQTPQGELTEILNNELAGAKNVLGMLRWLKSGEKFHAEASDKHQLIYFMEGQGSFMLEKQEHQVQKGMGVYLGFFETVTLQAASGGSLKVFHLVVSEILR